MKRYLIIPILNEKNKFTVYQMEGLYNLTPLSHPKFSVPDFLALRENQKKKDKYFDEFAYKLGMTVRRGNPNCPSAFFSGTPEEVKRTLIRTTLPELGIDPNECIILVLDGGPVK